jgi:hypothetical protein
MRNTMPTASLAKKLLIKPDQRIALVHAPEGYPAALGELPADVVVTKTPSATMDSIILFTQQRQDLDQALSTLLPLLRPQTLFWIAYRKGGTKAGTDLNRDLLWAALGEHGWTGVTLIALDEVWSVMRFRPADQVKSTS